MRITDLQIDGYGRFVSESVSFGPGLQVVFGPNERGKSTLRAFIIHMLYGQKSHIKQRRYEPGHDLRRPWQSAARYGGRLLYELDNGTAIEVHRVFGRKDEFIQVFDRTNGEEITATFEQYPNREYGFADVHLGVGKAVFEHVANIGHWTLTDLGDKDALADIRDRIVALADTASEQGSADAALKLLEERAVSIGRRTNQLNRPLPAANARLDALEAEWEAAQEHRRSLETREAERVQLAERVAVVVARRKMIAGALQAAAKQTRAARLAEAERISDEIRLVTQSVFEYRRAASFPLEEIEEAQRAVNAVETSRRHFTRTDEELKSLHVQFNEAAARAGGETPEDKISETFEREVSERQGKIERLAEKLGQYESDHEAARRVVNENAESDAPDFTILGADPAGRLSDLAASFRVAEQAANHARNRASHLESEVSHLRATVEQAKELLTEEGLPIEEVRAEAERAAKQLSTRKKAMISLAAAGVTLVAITGVLTFLTLELSNPGILVAAVLTGLGAIGTALRFAYNLARYADDSESADRTQAVREEQEAIHAKREAAAQRIRNELGIQSDEAFARHMQDVRDASVALGDRERELAECERAGQRAAADVEALRVQHADTFNALGESLAEGSAADAAHRLLRRHQAQESANNTRQAAQERKDKLEADIAKLRLELKALEGEHAAQLVELREALRAAGFGDEARHLDGLDALRAYRETLNERRDRRVRAEAIGEQRAAKERLREEARTSLEHDEAELRARLESAGVETVEEWEARAKEAKAYRDARATEQRLQGRLSDVLGGVSLEELKRQHANDGPLTEDEASSIEELIAALDIAPDADVASALRAEHDRAAAEADALQEQHHALQLELASAAAAIRPLNVIEEEREEARTRVAELTFELEAAAHAARVIDEVARNRHARLAPQMTTIASQHLNAITGGAYSELTLNRELGVSVRIPETQRMESDPAQVLSKGTVDQVYLALRLALVRVFSGADETIPMLLDDPFANYDDERLRHALKLLQNVAETNQIILFTCRDDVARAAREAGAAPMAI
jgi:uncharacterized protein YhaN